MNLAQREGKLSGEHSFVSTLLDTANTLDDDTLTMIKEMSGMMYIGEVFSKMVFIQNLLIAFPSWTRHDQRAY
jgi:hypothetical protein